MNKKIPPDKEVKQARREQREREFKKFLSEYLGRIPKANDVLEVTNPEGDGYDEGLPYLLKVREGVFDDYFGTPVLLIKPYKVKRKYQDSVLGSFYYDGTKTKLKSYKVRLVS